MTKMANRVQALEQKVVSAVPRKAHLIGITPYPTSEDAVAAFTSEHPDTEEDQFVVMVPMSVVSDGKAD